jgi:hypothetical protein
LSGYNTDADNLDEPEKAPTIAAFTARLKAHQDRGVCEMRADCDPRYAALALISPVIVAQMHQQDLGGATTHPLNIGIFIQGHAAAFLRGYAA